MLTFFFLMFLALNSYCEERREEWVQPGAAHLQGHSPPPAWLQGLCRLWHNKHLWGGMSTWTAAGKGLGET